MENIIFLKIEILILFISLGYIGYFIYDRITDVYFNVKKAIAPKKQPQKKQFKKININTKGKNYKKGKNNNNTLSVENKENLANILKRVKTNRSKGYFDVARTLIVEGLALDKYNKDLNLELAKIYEIEKKYKNAEYIYNEIIENVKDAVSVLKKLGFVLALQKKYTKAITTYEKVYKRDKSDIEVIDMLSNICFEIKNYKKAIKYTKLCLKNKPRNTEKLTICGKCYEKLGENEEALKCYKKVFELKPYDTLIIQKIKKLESR